MRKPNGPDAAGQIHAKQ